MVPQPFSTCRNTGMAPWPRRRNSAIRAATSVLQSPNPRRTSTGVVSHGARVGMKRYTTPDSYNPGSVGHASKQTPSKAIKQSRRARRALAFASFDARAWNALSMANTTPSGRIVPEPTSFAHAPMHLRARCPSAEPGFTRSGGNAKAMFIGSPWNMDIQRPHCGVATDRPYAVIGRTAGALTGRSRLRGLPDPGG